MPTWVAVPDWCKYEVSSAGLVRRGGRLIAQRKQRNGYWKVTLSDEPNGRRKTYMVHRLVCLCFHGAAPSPRHQVHHRNGVKWDNRSCNLEWVTPRQNRSDGRSAVGSRNGAAVLTEQQVIELRALYDGSEASVAEIGTLFKVSRQTVTKIGRRRAWTHI